MARLRFSWLGRGAVCILLPLGVGTVPALVVSSSGAATLPGTVGSVSVVNRTVGTGTAQDGLFPFTTVTGKVYMSLTAIGTNTPAGGPIYVQKRTASSTVEAAYLLAAGIPGFFGSPAYAIQNGTITLNGTALSFTPADVLTKTFTTEMAVDNVWTNVTTIVAPVVDAAAPGLVKFTAAEPTHTDTITGEILAVVMNDPTLTHQNTVSFLFGGLDPAGDTFSIGLANPLKLATTPNLIMSIGDSFGYQGPPGDGQYSTITVNTKRMTSAAGGNDDSICKYNTPQNFATCGNGELITVGGIGDTTTDPANPTATTANCATPPGPPRCTDELYTLKPFSTTGETLIKVKTTNPSFNDDIFFTGFELDNAAAVVGQGIVLTPTTGSNPVGSPYTLTAKVQNNTGAPIASRTVTFTILSGPNAGKVATATTNATGKATFTYTSSTGGMDTVQASFVGTTSSTIKSNDATVTWTVVAPTPSTLAAEAATGDYHDPTTVSATLTKTATSAAIVGKTVQFTLNGTETCTGTTNATGVATCSITPSEAAGTYTLLAAFAGGTGFAASTGKATFTETHEQTSIAYTGTTSVVNGNAITLSGKLTTDDPSAGTALGTKTVSFTLGTGVGAQTCTAKTNATGVASCKVTVVSQPIGTVPVKASFAGDTRYLPATVTSTVTVFAPKAVGAFVIGDLSAAKTAATQYFWGAQWAKMNKLSGGRAPSSMKGFADSPTSMTCGGTWTTRTGNSSAPPATITGTIEVIVSSTVTQRGSVLSGNVVHILMVKVSSYGPAPGHVGTGTIVGTVC